MKLSLTLIAAIVGAVYAAIVNFLHDFPISPEVLLAFIVYILAKLGVEIVEPAIRRQLVKRGLSGFQE